MRLAEPCIIARNQCFLTDLCPRVKRLWVRDDFAGIFECGQAPPNEIIQAKLFRPAHGRLLWGATGNSTSKAILPSKLT